MSNKDDSKPAAPDSRKLPQEIGKYSIRGTLGRGAMGVVYLAHDPTLERDVALKVMNPQVADDPELKERFQREAKSVARMTHPNVVAVFDLGQHGDGSLYIAMEMLKGQDLQKTLRAQTPLNLDRKVAIVYQVLQGLGHAHQAGIVHRDIKPANIFLNEDGGVKIMDFGVARLTTASMTGTGHIVGTADYMSPEQVKGAKVDGRSDIFSVGSVLFELLSGRRPFRSESLMTVFYKITHDEPDYNLIPEGEEFSALVPVLQRAMSKDADNRYQQAGQFASDLRAYLAMHATSASGRNVLENLLDPEAPTVPPGPIGESLGATVVQAGSDVLATGAATAGTRPTVQTLGVPSTMPGHKPPATRQPPAPRPPAPSGRRPPASRPIPRPLPRPAPRSSPVPAVLIGLAALGAVGGGGYYFWQTRTAPGASSATASLPPPTAAPAPAPTPVPAASAVPSAAPSPPEAGPTPAATPDPAQQARERVAATLGQGQSAFNRGRYADAQRHAQEALKQDAGNRQARSLLDRSLKGQEAERHLAAAEAALTSGEFDTATAEAATARELAPWDARTTSLPERIRQAQEQVQQQAQEQQQRETAAKVTALLAEADVALSGRRFDDAVRLFDQVLAIEPQNARAAVGRTGALAAKGAAAGPSRSFTAGQTRAQPAGGRSGATPTGFETGTNVSVQKGSQDADLPGKIVFDVSPRVVKPGDRYRVGIELRNEGRAPIRIARLVVTTTVNGRKSSGALPSSTKEVAPQQTAKLRELVDAWRSDVTSWSLEIIVFTGRGDRYTNTLTWK